MVLAHHICTWFIFNHEQILILAYNKRDKSVSNLIVLHFIQSIASVMKNDMVQNAQRCKEDMNLSRIGICHNYEMLLILVDILREQFYCEYQNGTKIVFTDRLPIKC